MGRQIKRFNIAITQSQYTIELSENENGAFVNYNDVAPLLAEDGGNNRQQPRAEIAWCKEAFDICKKHAISNDFVAMWQERENAVVALLSAAW
jgi:hypothetical protein